MDALAEIFDPTKVLGFLPESRLKNRTQGSVMMDWENPDGSLTRVEASKVYCANCGGESPYVVPEENTYFKFYLCQQCFEKYGQVAGMLAIPDDVFWAKVQEAMIENYGHILTEEELIVLSEQGWGPLEKLAKESPIKVYNGT